jgi:hypothetical protein
LISKMSEALVKESLVKITDPRVNLEKKLNYIIEEGGSVVSYVQSYTDGQIGNGSSFTFTNADPPGPNIIVDRKVMMTATFRLTFTGIPAAGVRLIGYEPTGNPADTIYNKSTGAEAAEYAGTSDIRPTGTDAPRAFPLAQIMNALNVTINNVTVSQPISDFIDPLLRYSSGRDVDESAFSMTASYQDQYQSYGDWLLHGSARNVLCDYGEQGYQSNRGGFSGIRWVRNPTGDGVNPVTAIFELTVTEPLFISPLDFGLPTINHRGIIGIQNFSVQVNVIGDLARVWSHDAVNGQPITSVSCIIASANQSLTKPYLQFTYITPRLLVSVPEINVYPYQYIDNFTTEFPGSITAPCYPKTFIDAPVVQLQSNNRQLSTVPKYIYIVARESNSTRSFTSTDSYAFIRNLSIDFDNNTNLLNSMSPQQLYNMSIKNGCDLTWSQWTRFVGSVVCINVAQDLNLREDLLPGIRDGNLNFRVRADIINVGSVAKQYSLYVFPVYPGLFNIGGNQAVAQTGIISKSDILAVNGLQSMDYHAAYNYYGGKLDFRGLKEMGSKFLKGLKVAAPVLKTLAPIAKTLAPRLTPAIDIGEDLLDRLVAAGYTKKQAMQIIKGKGLVGGASVGGDSVGGKKMTKAHMRRLLLA